MDDPKQTIAKNISEVRKQLGLTQAEFGEKLNYTDKAVSKWERAESIPDIIILKQIAEMGNVTLDFMAESEHMEPVPSKSKVLSPQQRKNRLMISLLAISLVWLIATMLFVYIGIYTKEYNMLWVVFVYAVPATLVVVLVFNSIWGNRRFNFLIVTLLLWSVFLCVYLALIKYNLWPIFIIGIPSQIIIIFWSRIKIEKH